MKNLIAIFILIITTNFVAISQNEYQTFPAAGFKVKCGCALHVNSVFLDAAKTQGADNIIAAYICAENEDDPQTGVIVNINVYDETENLEKVKSEYHDYYKKKCLEKYAANLTQAGISFQYVSYLGETALEYTFDQYGVPTKVLMFYKNQRSYLLQVATRSELYQKYNALKASFVIL